MAISLSLKWLWAGWEEEMRLNFVLWICLSLWVKAPKYKGVGTTVSTMVSCGCMLIIHTFNPILLFFFSFLCFLSFLFCKCQGLVRWPPFCGCLGHSEPQVSTGSTLLLKGLTWCTRGEAGFTVGPAFWCQHTVTFQLVCLIKQWGQENTCKLFTKGKKAKKKSWSRNFAFRVWALCMLRDVTAWFVWELKCAEISLLLSSKV